MTRIERAGDADPGSLSKGGEEYHLLSTLSSILPAYLTFSLRLADKTPAVRRPSGGIWPLLGFEVTPGKITRIADVPETIYFGRVSADGHIEIGEVKAVERQAGHVPVVDEGTQVAGLPTEGTGAVEGEWSGDGGCDRAACAPGTGRRRARGGVGRRGCVCAGWGQGWPAGRRADDRRRCGDRSIAERVIALIALDDHIRGISSDHEAAGPLEPQGNSCPSCQAAGALLGATDIHHKWAGSAVRVVVADGDAHAHDQVIGSTAAPALRSGDGRRNDQGGSVIRQGCR